MNIMTQEKRFIVITTTIANFLRNISIVHMGRTLLNAVIDQNNCFCFLSKTEIMFDVVRLFCTIYELTVGCFTQNALKQQHSIPPYWESIIPGLIEPFQFSRVMTIKGRDSTSKTLLIDSPAISLTHSPPTSYFIIFFKKFFVFKLYLINYVDV